MINTGRFLAMAAATALAILPAAAPAGAGTKGNLVAGATKSKDHETLVAAVKAAGLVDTLASGGPFTVFAPTDAAFAKLPAGTVDTLLQPANRDQLRAVLTYHVVPGKVTASDVTKLSKAKTVEGSSISINTHGGVKVDNANVVKTDIMASNGVIHVIDSVIMPR